MTETRPRRRKPGPLPVVLGTIATFLVVLALLAVQLRAGHDPVLGTGTPVAVAAGGHQPVVTRSSGATPSASATVSPNQSTQAVTTRTSGGGEREGEDD